MKRRELDSFVVNVEFLLISVIQGAALATLGAFAVEPIARLDFLYIPYVLSALVFILIFWAQAIVHTISFIKWPIDIIHNLLYFIVGLTEIMAFTQLGNPLSWFGFIFLFFVIAAILYWYDLRLINKVKNDFQNTDSRKELFKDIIGRERLELYVFVPLALFYNGLSFWLILSFPHLFTAQKWNELLVFIQLVFGIFVMIETLNGFKKRINLVTKTIE